jgi:CCR4-NOT transcription complex subunit 3
VPTPSALIPSSPAASHLLPALAAPSIATPTTYHFSQDAVTSSPSLTQLSVTSPVLSSAASVSQQLDGSFYSGQESPAVSEANAISISSSVRKGLHN